MDAKTRWGKKAYCTVALVAVLGLLFFASAAFGAVKFSDAIFRGYATGTVLHADAVQSGDTRLLGVEEAFSGSQVDSNGLTQVKNEMERVVTNASATHNSQGRGAGLEACIAAGKGDECQIAQAGNLPSHSKAEAMAPPSTEVITNDMVNVPGNPLIYASVLRGQAQAVWSDSQCILGQDISFGKGYAGNVQLVNTGAANEDGSFESPLIWTGADYTMNGVMSSHSHQFMDVARNNLGTPVSGVWGLSSEVRMVIAPITLFRGTPNELTLDFAALWVLRAEAAGLPSHSRIVYGPEGDTQIPLLRVIQGGKVTNVVGLDQVLAALGQGGGLEIDASPIAHITIGGQPRAIGGDFGSTAPIAADGTFASAAVDVAKISLLNPDLAARVGELRIGHMEVEAQVPSGGINCSNSPTDVTHGAEFVVTIKDREPVRL